MRDKQPGVLRLRLADSVLRPDGDHGGHVRADRPAAAQEGPIRGRASGERPVPATGRPVCAEARPHPHRHFCAAAHALEDGRLRRKVIIYVPDYKSVQ